MNGDYDPDAMFPRREKKTFMKRIKEKIKRWLTIIGLSVFVVLCGAGCKSLPGTLEVDTPFFDIEYIGTDKE